MNKLAEFPADQFRILAACEACDHTDWLDRIKLPDDMYIDVLRERVVCQVCGNRDCGIRIVYVGSGEFEYRQRNSDNFLARSAKPSLSDLS